MTIWAVAVIANIGDLALVDHVRAHLVIDDGASVTLLGSALSPDQVLLLRLALAGGDVACHHAPALTQ